MKCNRQRSRLSRKQKARTVCILVLLCLVPALLLGGCRLMAENRLGKAEQYQLSISSESVKPYINCLHYEEQGFLQAVRDAAAYDLEDRLLAATSSHFLPVMSFTANMLCTLAQYEDPESPIETIVIVAPNHSGDGLPLQVTDCGWATPFGNLEADEDIVSALLHEPRLAGSIGINTDRLRSDHSASTLIPFVKYYMPDVKVVTVLLNRNCSLDQLYGLSDVLREASRSTNLFLMASVDFSHYLPITETAQRDAYTEKLITERDIAGLKVLDGGNADSPEALITMLLYGSQYPQSEVFLQEHVILPESDVRPDIGYSYNVYLMTDKAEKVLPKNLP